MRSILEELIYVGSTTETYKIFGKEWKLKTLSSEEQTDASASTGHFDNVSRINALKCALLARSICEIEGQEIDDITEKIKFLTKAQAVLIDVLYEKYEELQRKQDKVIKELNPELKN